MLLSPLGEKRERRPISLPRLVFQDVDNTAVVAQELYERRVIRLALDQWHATNKASSFQALKVIGAALLLGRDHALRVTGANAPHGHRYAIAFREWMKAYGFGTMSKETRTYIITLTENASAIEQWLLGLPERERNRMANPQHIVRRWKAATAHGNGRCLADLAMIHWRRFRSCLAAMPPDEAAALWGTLSAEVAENFASGFASELLKTRQNGAIRA
jgi:hypothetical protein